MPIVNFKYEHRLVAFLDVMGFKELLRGDPEALDKIELYFSTVTTVIEGIADGYKRLYVGHAFASALISDAVILSVRLPESQQERNEVAARFLSAVGFLQYRLAIYNDIWLRGAVSSGNFYINEELNITVGPAFVQAYELEQIANFSRVIVDPRVCHSMDCLPAEFVTLMNKISSVGKLMPYPVIPKIGMTQNDPSAIEIDWFSHAFTKDDPLEGFLSGIRRRSVTSHNLFVKCHLLVRMLRDSLIAAESRGVEPSGRTIQIETFLAEFGV